MKKLFVLYFGLLLTTQAFSQSVVNCVIETSLGKIEIELYPEKAPSTVSNFLKYVDANLYENSSFYRVCTPENEAEREVKIEVIQGGITDRSKALDAIQLETTEVTGLTHEDGSLSMARTGQPHSATSHFFICIGPQPELDFGGKRSADAQGFAAFGKVTKGMDIVRKIQQGENKRQRLTEAITILSIKRVK
ncbi:MAG: peptidylprolyl isomerase [Roseivirga sp.]|nr:peptidylprolyl isomerase [Roseivirga sp.]